MAISEGAGQLYMGCAVWAFADWAGGFYPPKSASRDFLDLYVRRLTAVEGNTTFYSTPRPEVVARWRERMPESFAFVPKLPRDVTHDGPLAARTRAAADFLQVMSALGPRLRAVFAQLPPTHGPDAADDLAAFLSAWPEQAPPLLAEVRHPAWYREPHRSRLDDLLRNTGVGRVILDTRPVYESEDDPQWRSRHRKPQVPLVTTATARTVMVRYIGYPDVERNARWLPTWSQRVDDWLRAGHDVLFFAHCPGELQSPDIAREMHRLLIERGAPIQPLPWDDVQEEPEEPEQLTLF